HPRCRDCTICCTTLTNSSIHRAIYVAFRQCQIGGNICNRLYICQVVSHSLHSKALPMQHLLHSILGVSPSPATFVVLLDKAAVTRHASRNHGEPQEWPAAECVEGLLRECQ